jgi:hypothetical protein
MPNAVPYQRERIEVKAEVLAEVYRTLPRDKMLGSLLLISSSMRGRAE